MPATPKSTNNMYVAARMIRVVVTHNSAEPRMITARMINNLLVEVQHQLRAVEDGILKVICELDGVEVAGVGTELAEHAVAQVVLIVVKHLLLLSRLRILNHVAQNLDSSIGT